MPKHIARSDPHYFDALFLQECIAPLISLRPVTHIMCNAIDLDPELGAGAIKVEHIGPDGMLPAKFDPSGFPRSSRQRRPSGSDMFLRSRRALV